MSIGPPTLTHILAAERGTARMPSAEREPDTSAQAQTRQWFEAEPLWFKRALFYEIHVRGFYDANGDGLGDLRGIQEKLDYLRWLGVDCIWLLPMYASPLRDGGYDIADFFAIHPDYGNVDDFRAFVAAAHERGLRVIADLDVLRFWLDLGIDGFRLDAVPYLYEREGSNCENLPDTHAYLRRLRREIDARYPDRVLLAEANQWPEDVVAYFGDGDECHMAFHFPVMPRMFMSLRREDATPIIEILDRTPAIPANAQWGLFLRNHDELTLEMVTDEERDYMYTEYAKDPRMKLNLGIRRRLAPLLDNARADVELLHAIMFSLPGSPVLYYGDEIAMGDNIYLGDRDGVRTPMQWTGDRNGGFSRADFAALYLPPLMDPVYGFQAVNVEAQLRTPSSLLRWVQRFVQLRKEHPVFGLGTYEPLHPENGRIFAHVRRYE